MAILRPIPKTRSALMRLRRRHWAFTVHYHSNSILSGLSPTLSCNTIQSSTRYPRGRVLTVPPYRIPVQFHIIILIRQSTNHIPSKKKKSFSPLYPSNQPNQPDTLIHPVSLLIPFPFINQFPLIPFAFHFPLSLYLFWVEP